MILRRYEPADVDAIIAMFRDTVRRVNRSDYTAEQVRAWAPDEVDVAHWAATLASRHTVVAESAGAIVGFAELADGGNVDRFYVHADQQRRGIGTRLMEALVAEAAQFVDCRGVRMMNYRMQRPLNSP